MAFFLCICFLSGASEKIFSALRDEIYDQINLITKHERLSKKEKEAVEGLKDCYSQGEGLRCSGSAGFLSEPRRRARAGVRRW